MLGAAQKLKVGWSKLPRAKAVGIAKKQNMADINSEGSLLEN
jgi:hypothetical protein